MGKSEEETESEEEEEEEGEIELTTLRRTKTKGRKSKKEVREQATYKDKLQGSQLTLEKLLKKHKKYPPAWACPERDAYGHQK